MDKDITSIALQSIIDMMRKRMAEKLPGRNGKKADGSVITIEVAKPVEVGDDESDIKKRLRALGKL